MSNQSPLHPSPEAAGSRFLSLGREGWGLLLIFVGVAAWIPYGLFKYGLGREIVLYPFLAWHLAGVIPGFLLRRWTLLRRIALRLLFRPPARR